MGIGRKTAVEEQINTRARPQPAKRDRIDWVKKANELTMSALISELNRDHERCFKELEDNPDGLEDYEHRYYSSLD